VSGGFISSLLCDGDGRLLSPDGDREVLLNVVSGPVDLSNDLDGCAGSDSDWLEEIRTMVPDRSKSWDRGIVVPVWGELALSSVSTGSFDVLALLVRVDTDVNLLSDRRGHVECRFLAGSTTIAGSSCDTDTGTVTTSQPVGKFPVG